MNSSIKTETMFFEARKSIVQYMDWYNTSRPHSSLEKKTPEEAYTILLPVFKMAV